MGRNSVAQLPGVLAYGETREGAISAAEALALRVRADCIEHGEFGASPSISFHTAPSAAE